jgi:hypothetical protein
MVHNAQPRWVLYPRALGRGALSARALELTRDSGAHTPGRGTRDAAAAKTRGYSCDRTCTYQLTYDS